MTRLTRCFYIFQKKTGTRKWEEVSFAQLDALIKAAQSNNETFVDFVNGVSLKYLRKTKSGEEFWVLIINEGLFT